MEGWKVPKAWGRVEGEGEEGHKGWKAGRCRKHGEGWKVKVRKGTKDGRLEDEDGRGKGGNEDDTVKNGRY